MKKYLVFLTLFHSMVWAGGEGAQEVEKTQEQNEAAQAQPASSQESVKKHEECSLWLLSISCINKNGPYFQYRLNRDSWDRGCFKMSSAAVKHFVYFLKMGWIRKKSRW